MFGVDPWGEVFVRQIERIPAPQPEPVEQVNRYRAIGQALLEQQGDQHALLKTRNLVRLGRRGSLHIAHGAPSRKFIEMECQADTHVADLLGWHMLFGGDSGRCSQRAGQSETRDPVICRCCGE